MLPNSNFYKNIFTKGISASLRNITIFNHTLSECANVVREKQFLISVICVKTLFSVICDLPILKVCDL